MEDLSQYRLNSTKELADLAGKYGDGFDAFFLAVYKVIDELPEGGSFDILANVHEENQELFVKCACFYILDKNPRRESIYDASVEFSNDFRYVRKLESWYPTVFPKKRRGPQSTTL